MTERDIQRRVYRLCVSRGVKWQAPNIWLFAWESDFISVSRAGVITEYEIKISRSDFLADRKKPRDVRQDGPTYFWYVCPEGMIQPEEVPDYAGLAWTSPGYRLLWMKPAPVLHRRKITGRQSLKLLTSCYFRFWSLWMKS